ncbi:hypothetical protein ACLOJK_009215 [Asimina triloba]
MIDLDIWHNKLVSELRLFGLNRSSRLRSHQLPIPVATVAAAASSFVSTPPICDDTSIGIRLHPPIAVSTPPTATIRLPSASVHLVVTPLQQRSFRPIASGSLRPDPTLIVCIKRPQPPAPASVRQFSLGDPEAASSSATSAPGPSIVASTSIHQRSSGPLVHRPDSDAVACPDPFAQTHQHQICCCCWKPIARSIVRPIASKRAPAFIIPRVHEQHQRTPVENPSVLPSSLASVACIQQPVRPISLGDLAAAPSSVASTPIRPAASNAHLKRRQIRSLPACDIQTRRLLPASTPDSPSDPETHLQPTAAAASPSELKKTTATWKTHRRFEAADYRHRAAPAILHLPEQIACLTSTGAVEGGRSSPLHRRRFRIIVVGDNLHQRERNALTPLIRADPLMERSPKPILTGSKGGRWSTGWGAPTVHTIQAHLISLYIGGTPLRGCEYFGQGVQLSRNRQPPSSPLIFSPTMP